MFPAFNVAGQPVQDRSQALFTCMVQSRVIHKNIPPRSMVAKKSPNSYSHLWLFHATILDAGTHFRLSAAFGLNLGCHFSDIFSFSLAESPVASQLDWLLEELLGYHNPHRPVNAEPEFLVLDLQL